MVEWSVIERLTRAFPKSFINGNGEIIIHKYSNTSFILKNCETEKDVYCKMLEWLSRPAHKTQPYRTEKKNNEFHKFILDGINRFMNTSFTEEDMDIIYTYLGNACNHELTIKFIDSGYDMDLLKRKDELNGN